MNKPRLTRAAMLLGFLASLGAVALLTGFPATLLKRWRSPRLERIVFEGKAASHRTIDCEGGWFNDGRPTELIIQSKKTADGWERPEGITIRNCRIRGAIRVIGLGRNGEAVGVRRSSVKAGHTERAQAATPIGIVISNVEIEACCRIPLYLAPGVTGVTLDHSKLTGWSCSTGIYLDAESGNNLIRSNTFSVRASREVIAVDGSAGNRIEGNRFDRIAGGGVYLYRNCGEGGTVRHQTPRDNVIAGNRFDTRSLGWRSHAIWLGSRNGWRLYCGQDAGYPFGSSADNRDLADENAVVGNVFVPSNGRAIRDDGRNNRLDRQGPCGGR